MKKMLCTLIVAALVSMPASAQAAPRKALDVSTITCAQIMDNTDNPEGLGLLLAWLDGYTSAKTGSTLISPPWMAKIGLRVTSYCAKHPEAKIMDAMKTMLPQQ